MNKNDFPYLTGSEVAAKLGITRQAFHQRKDKPTPVKVTGSGKNTTHWFKVEDVEGYMKRAGKKVVN